MRASGSSARGSVVEASVVRESLRQGQGLDGVLGAGDEVRGYRIARVLRAGQANNVYQGFDRSGREVAIKEYFPRKLARRLASGRISVPTERAKLQFEEGVKAFISEAATMASIKSRLIAKFVGVFRENGTAYLVTVMEPGQTLEEWFRSLRTKKLYPTESDVRLVFWTLLHAVEAVHRYGYLHLDIKPSNVVLREESRSVLLDLGGARRFPHEPDAKAALVWNYTPGFAALEQHLERSTALCPATDIYGVGASIMYCMTGKIPPVAIDRLQEDRIGDLIDRCHMRYSSDLIGIVERCMRVSLDDRADNIRVVQSAVAAR